MDSHLRVFVTVAEKKNFSRTAEELHMTQPAVSQYIQALERTVGAKLIERNNKFVCLTKAGDIVYHHAKEIMGLYTHMQSLVDDLMQVASGNLSIGASYTFGEYILPHVIARLHGRYPLIQPTVTIGNTTEIAESVADRRLDVGIVEGEFNHERLNTESFAKDWMVIIVPADHPLTRQKEVTVPDLKKENWIVREKGSGTREATEKMFKKLGFTPDHLMEFGSTQLIKESVEAGLGISFLSNWAVRKEESLGTIHLLKMDGTPIPRKFTWITQDTPFQTKALEVFIDEMRRLETLFSTDDPRQ
ncbi:LysR family transcriptional regulator [Kroppenstedtia eburnea]|uniref:DNA-binding transcriptional regulator, LysR family n=1 Tax=Kroppenstedtia eburnea TaxID=714067 RepID=A0A1N7J3L9_9BACL|nr:LysR family transcriptional regulator [Kroppenstedtia eburnea]EGK13239.1 LysR family transcriptional regulator [Desmospora sp. 8437]QKI82468.1 LysR family transcriptional regulator [Kroppenstedtia eburnea]SIS43837.1 DNA-binding transcriptional regulator, LysR family [Kroppenstedtia eburnea]